MPRIPRFVPYVAIIAFVLWCAISLRGDMAKLSLRPLLHAWDVIAAAAVLSMLNYALRAFRWRAFLTRLGHPLSWRLASLSYVAGFAYTLSPGKVGEIMRARYYAPFGVPLASVAATFFAERLMDLIAMVALAALLLTAGSRYSGATAIAAALVVLALTALVLTPWSTIATAVQTWKWVPRSLVAPLNGVLSALVSTRPLLGLPVLSWGLGIGLIAWGLEGIGLGLLGTIYQGTPLELLSAIGIYGVAVLIGSLSLLPGGLGGTEAVMTALLVSHGFPVGDALLLTLVCRFVTLWLAVLLGWIAVFVLRHDPVVAKA